MKFYIAIGVVLAAFILVDGEKPCSEESECAEYECCIVKGYIPFRKGRCEKLSEEGKPCSKEEEAVAFFGGKYYHNCPCEENFDCVGDIKKDKWGNEKEVDPKCTVPPTKAPEEPETEAPEEPETEAPEEPETEAPEEGGDGGSEEVVET